MFCFFTDNVRKFRPIVRRLALWLDLGQPSTLPKSTRLKVLIVTKRGEGLGDDELDLRDFKRMLSEETTIDVSEQFLDIRLLSLTARKNNLLNKARYRELFEHLLNFSDQVREARFNTQTLFSAYHFIAFFDYALDHVAETLVEPFNFIATSRIENPVFGSDKSILEYSSITAIGARIGVVASTIKPELFLFTNYNRLGDRKYKNREKYGVLLGDTLYKIYIYSTGSSVDSQEDSDSFYRKELDGLKEDLKVRRKRRRGEYFRFNVEFNGREPRLDDLNKIPGIKILAREVMLHSKQLDRLAYYIITELFVFELDPETIPRRENSRYSYTGYILCCHRAGTPAFKVLLSRLIRSSAKFLLRGRTLSGSIRDRLSLIRDGNFRKRVYFDVASKQDLVSLYLREGSSESYNISGSLFSVAWLIGAQELRRPFSRRDSVKRKRKENEKGLPKKRPRILTY
ncbi:hypothetical protein G7Y89_g7277 [Cudoniella acicularis]|uniref:Uncharacterized protein n=1 Tax=Cudoniella acicularis TaxID=354080 RepID=A0A8H4RKF0_9HELO|nr:hypothetical protein G7Y89_g7277 [Cudoniella acicularis]